MLHLHLIQVTLETGFQHGFDYDHVELAISLLDMDTVLAGDGAGSECMSIGHRFVEN